MDTTTNPGYYLEAIKENGRIDHLADPPGVPTPAMVQIVPCQTVLIRRPISRHVEWGFWHGWTCYNSTNIMNKLRIAVWRYWMTVEGLCTYQNLRNPHTWHNFSYNVPILAYLEVVSRVSWGEILARPGMFWFYRYHNKSLNPHL